VATKRDLVEAHAFSRRRLVTAFVSGAPGGREVEPARSGRTIVGGLALAVLLVAGAAVAGVLLGRDPEDWNKPGLLISEDKGGLYVILEESDHPELHSILNITSAQLILGPDLEPTILAEDTIAAQDLGQDLGILGAPQTVPDTERLIESGWSACTSEEGGLAVTMTDGPTVEPLSGQGFTVLSEGRYYVIATGREEAGEPLRSYSYALPAGVEVDPLLDSLGLPITDDAREVPEQWLRLFPAGGSLDFASLGLQGYGDPARERGPGKLPDDARIGEIITLDGETFQVLTDQGPADLDPFAKAVYEAVPKPALEDPLSLEPRRLPSAPLVGGALPPFAGAHWPDSELEPVLDEHCALLQTTPGEKPAVLLASSPSEAASAEGLAAGDERVSVDPGHGAFVQSGDWEDASSSTTFVIDAKGVAYGVDGAEAARQLGYESSRAPVVPDPWVELFEPGVVLSRSSALCPPVQVREDAESRTCE
jgi:type VII secretion protein EccB